MQYTYLYNIHLLSRYTKNISKMAAHAANAYFTAEDMEMIHQVKDVKKWSSRMREPMENIYGEDYFPILWEEWVDAITKIANSTPDKNICRELLPQIRCPTLIIHGSKDAMVCVHFCNENYKKIPKSNTLPMYFF